MPSVYVEVRPLKQGSALSKDLANHLFTRLLIPGPIVVLAANPIASQSAIAKQWRKVMARVERARASTLDHERLIVTTRLYRHMQQLYFSSRPPVVPPDRGVFILKADDFQAVTLSNCSTAYVTVDIGEAQMAKLEAAMPRGSLLVEYKSSK